MAKLLSVNVGLPRDMAWHGETVHTGIWKQPAQGRSIVRRQNIDGDGQGDLAGHGGEHRAVMVYQMDSYRYWEGQLNRHDFVFGQFGENLTVEGLADNEVCMGDRYRIGQALFEVTQPRVTCYRLGIRMDEPRMPSLVVSHHRPGFYFRVLQEGQIGAGDEIVKVADGPERMSVAEIDALLYLPGHSKDQLERALRIPALSAGWKGSFKTLIDPQASGPAWPGFRSLRLGSIHRESANVISLSFQARDGSALPAALPGQFLILRLRPNPDLPPILRNYSMSGAPGDGPYRVSVKREENGIASTFLHNHAKVGDVFEVAAPRGSFTLQAGDGPVVFLSAGIGATPVLAMLHDLVAVASPREVWWLYGARNRAEHPFAQESQGLLHQLQRSHSFVAYSRPGPEDRLGQDYDSSGHLSVQVLEQLGVPRTADFYSCGPAAFLTGFAGDLKTWGVPAGRIHAEIFGPAEAITPGIAPLQQRTPHAPPGTTGSGPRVSFARSGLAVPWNPSFGSLLEFAEACDISVRWACRTGVCHTCESALIGGAVDYNPEPLEPPASGNVLICCSQPRVDLEIDL